MLNDFQYKRFAMTWKRKKGFKSIIYNNEEGLRGNLLCTINVVKVGKHFENRFDKFGLNIFYLYLCFLGAILIEALLPVKKNIVYKTDFFHIFFYY